ncbi:hypothetical protein [Vibrio phage BONAISHI]|nr:hypothetical protein [Vibrio phage BONAISHI]
MSAAEEFSNPFFFEDIGQYKRDFDILGNYQKTVAQHISLHKGFEFEHSLRIVKRMMVKMFPAKSPDMKVMKRPVRGDRKLAKIDFLSYIDFVAKNDHIMTPNLICYANPKVERSFIAGFIDENLAVRKAVKKEGHAAKLAGNDVHATFCNLLQANYKIRNNSISGATSSAHNPLYYTTAHTALTSFCRAMTTTANSINERMLASNRHYFTPDVAIENVNYIIRTADLGMIAVAMQEHGIVPPSEEYTIDLILRSGHKYWRSDLWDQKIRNFIKTLSPVQRAAFCFCNDMHALQETNDKYMRGFFNELLWMPEIEHPDPDAEFNSTEEDLIVLLGPLCASFMEGRSWGDLKEDDPSLYARTATRIAHIKRTLKKHSDVIRAFYTTDVMPQNLHQFPSVVREAVVASDTDSSIFSCQRQVKWYTGSYDTNELSIPLTGIVTFMVSQNIAHNLGILCAQIGVEEKQLMRPTMKTEFQFNVFAVTPKTKHYLATMEVQEGNVYDKTKYEIKGVNLKNSKLPPEVKAILEDYQKGLMNKIKNNEELTPQMVMAVPAYVEHKIMEDLRKNSATWFKAMQIKTKATYANTSVYRFVPFWNNVFGPKYGKIELLPTPCIEVKVSLEKPAQIDAWLETLPPDMARRARDAINDEEYGFKNGLTRIIIPMELIIDNQLPVEISNIINDRRVLADMMGPFYLTMMTTRLHVVDKKLSIFASDLMTKEDAKKHLWLDIKI